MKYWPEVVPKMTYLAAEEVLIIKSVTHRDFNDMIKVIRMRSPMRAEKVPDYSDVPSREAITRAHAAALRLKKGMVANAGDLGQFGSCKVWGNVEPGQSMPVSGSPDMSDVRKQSNHSKWEVMPFESLRTETKDHYLQMRGVSLYKMDGNKLNDLVCVRHSSKSEDQLKS